MKITPFALAAILVATAAFAEDHPAAQKPHAAFDRLKTLAGSWEMKIDGKRTTTVYRVVSNGSAIEELLMPETASMINMIHPDGDALMMTHYCAGANQPRYRAATFEGNSIDFRFADGTNIGESYMAGVKLILVDENHLKQEWIFRDKGKDTTMTFDFTRAK